MNKFLIIGAITIIACAGIFIFYGLDEGNTITITGYVQSESLISPWEIHITGKEFTGSLERADIFETGAITLKGTLYPDPNYHSDLSEEIYKDECNTGKTLDVVFGEKVGFSLTFRRVNDHSEEYPDGMWFILKFDVYETTGGIPFTEIRWGERKIGTGQTTLYVDFPGEDEDPGEGTLKEATGILTTVDSFEDLEQGVTKYYIRASIYNGLSLTFKVSDQPSQTELYNFLYSYKTKEVKIKYLEYDDETKVFVSIEEIENNEDDNEEPDDTQEFTGIIKGSYDKGGGYIFISLENGEKTFYVCKVPCQEVTILVNEINDNKGKTLKLYYEDDGVKLIYRSHTIN